MGDAFTAGVLPGGLTTREEIRILLCYMLDSVGQPMHRSTVTDIIIGEGMANYFNTEEAISTLVEDGHLLETEDHCISVTATGSEIGRSLSTRVPYTLRGRSVQAALRLFKRRELEKDNKVEIRKAPDGGCEVVCTVLDQERTLMSVTLRVADEQQAKQIGEGFLDDPTLLYRSTLAILNGEGTWRCQGTQLYIQL